MIGILQLSNFRSHRATMLNLSDFNVLMGPMGAGKTSACHALALLLTGQNPIVNAKGEGLREEIMEGADEFKIGCQFDDGTKIIRHVTADNHVLSFNGSAGNLGVTTGKILAKLGIDIPEVALCLLDPTQFAKRDEKARRRVLMTLMASKSIEAPPLVKELGLAQSFSTVGEIDSMIKDLKESKVRDLNREIKTLNAQIAPEVVFDPKHKAALADRLKELNQKRDQVVRAQARYEQWEKTLQSLQQQFDNTEKVEASVSDEELAKAEASEREKVNAIRQEWSEADKDRKRAQIGLSNSDAALTVAFHARKLLEGIGKQCPTCQREMKPSDKAKLVDYLKTQEAGLQKAVDAAKADLATVASKIAGIEKRGEEQKKLVELAQNVRSEHKRKADAYAMATSALEEHQKNKPESDENWPRTLSSVAEDIAAASIDLQAETEKEGESSRRDIQVASVRAKEQQVEKLSSAAEELAELKDEILSVQSGGLIDDMDAFVGEFGLGKVAFSLDPLGFTVGGLHDYQLSGGQKVILEAALRQAAAKASGLRIMALDDANMLTQDVRQKLSKVLSESRVQTIICSMTDKEPVIGAPLPDNWRMYFLTSPGLCGPTTIKPIGVTATKTA